MRPESLPFIFLVLLLVVPASVAGTQGVAVSHLYELSDFNGTIPYSDALVHVDRSQDEVYVTEGGTVRVFNGAGMEVYRFSKDWATGSIYGVGAKVNGDVLLLIRDYTTSLASPAWSLHQVDYRGRPLGPVEIHGMPDGLASFSPDRMVLRGEDIFLVSSSQLRVVVVGTNGLFRRSHDLAALLQIEDPANTDLFGFALDRDGNMLFTIPVMFKLFIVSTDEEIRLFGTPGSAPGSFGIISGVVGDDRGNYLVADKLRNVVMVFDPSFKLVTEIGFEGGRKNLVRPTDLALGNSGRIYITQAQNRGVSVYSVTQAVGEFSGQPVRNEKGGAQSMNLRHGGVGDLPTGQTGAVPRNSLTKIKTDDLPYALD